MKILQGFLVFMFLAKSIDGDPCVKTDVFLLNRRNLPSKKHCMMVGEEDTVVSKRYPMELAECNRNDNLQKFNIEVVGVVGEDDDKEIEIKITNSGTGQNKDIIAYVKEPANGEMSVPGKVWLKKSCKNCIDVFVLDKAENDDTEGFWNINVNGYCDDYCITGRGKLQNPDNDIIVFECYYPNNNYKRYDWYLTTNPDNYESNTVDFSGCGE